jgi:NAD(P)-dependent dehydrogenase (short-subunit alcohol dehydrogenase family)
MDRHPHVLITGASSGIGRALALACAAPGVTLHLSGRDAERLGAVADACRERGAYVLPCLVDVRDTEKMAAWIEGAGPLDLVVANAGIGAGGSDEGPNGEATTRDIFATNLDGVLNTALPALRVMQQQPPGADGVRGRVAVIASLAAFIASPGAPAYCASKAAADSWTLAMGRQMRPEGIVMTSVCPGFVRTPITDQHTFRMPGLMEPDAAAAIILRGIAAGRARVCFPRKLHIMSRLVQAMPPALGAWLLATRSEGRMK